MKGILLSVLCLSCSPGENKYGFETSRKQINAPKIGSERTEGPLGPLVAGSLMEVTYGLSAQSGSVPTGYSVSIIPPDMTTSAGASLLEVNFDTRGDVAPFLARVVQSIRLRTWPELVDVPITYSFSQADQRAASAEGTTAHPFATASIVPSSPIADRWYVLSYVPAVGLSHDPAHFHQLLDGSVGARFRPGSEVSIARIRTAVGGDHMAMVVELTERAALSNGALVSIIDDDGLHCVPDARRTASGSVRGILFRCDRIPEGKEPLMRFALSDLVARPIGEPSDLVAGGSTLSVRLAKTGYGGYLGRF